MFHVGPPKLVLNPVLTRLPMFAAVSLHFTAQSWAFTKSGVYGQANVTAMELQTASSVSAASQARLRLYQQQSLAIARPGYKAKRSRRVLNQSMGFQTNMEDIAALIPNDCSEAANLIHVYKTAPLIGCFDSSDTKVSHCCCRR